MKIATGNLRLVVLCLVLSSGFTVVPPVMAESGATTPASIKDVKPDAGAEANQATVDVKPDAVARTNQTTSDFKQDAVAKAK
jgi:predicted secreted protein